MRKSGCAIVALFLLLVGSVLVNGLLLVSMGASSATGIVVETEPVSYNEQLILPGDGEGKIVVIPMDGVIAYNSPGSLGESMVEDLKAAFRQAAGDDDVRAVVMTVNSPGGEITASDVIYHEIQKLKEKKPVVYFMNSIGASGAYYAACGASWVMCNETTFTGSIGVIISTLNYKELFGKIGLDSIVFKSGKFKDMLNGARDISPEEAAYVQGLVMQSYDKFVGIVAEARGLDEASLRTGVADGRILSGEDAFAAKLVDELGYIEDAYAKAQELGAAPGARVVSYQQNFSFGNFFRLLGESRGATKVEVDLLEGMPKLQPGRTYLLPSFYAP